MRTLALFLLGWTGIGSAAAQAPGDATAVAPTWSFNATVIEACSCPMFCQCYFNDRPAGQHVHDADHHDHDNGQRFCRFNLAYRVNRGHYRDVSLDGVMFWLAGDLGEDFVEGDWAVLTYDPSTTPAQREALRYIVERHALLMDWASFTVADDAPMTWSVSDDRAEARLADGDVAEVVLRRFPGLTGDPIVLSNLPYWNLPRNEGFILMPNEVQAYRAGDRPFEFRSTNGFVVTVDMNSDDVE